MALGSVLFKMERIYSEINQVSITKKNGGAKCIKADIPAQFCGSI